MASYFDECCRSIDRYLPTLGGRTLHVQIFNEQNMPRWALWDGYGEGFGDSYSDMLHFNEWFCKGWQIIKQRFGGQVKVGFSPLAIANYDVYLGANAHKNVAYYMHGPEAAKPSPTKAEIDAAIKSGPCYEALTLADEYYAHCYLHWGEGAWRDSYYGLRFLQYAKFFPKHMDVWILESGIPRAADWHTWTLPSIKSWLQFLNSCHDPERFTMRGAALWILGDNPEWGGIWEDRRSEISELIRFLPNRQNEEPLPPVPPPAATFTAGDKEKAQGLVNRLTGVKKACLKKGYFDLGVETLSDTPHFIIALAWDPEAKRTLRCKIHMPSWEISDEEAL